MQAVYPDLFASIQNEITNQMMDTKINYKQKMTIGRLLSINSTPSMAKIQNLQNNFIKHEKQEQAVARMKASTITNTSKAMMLPSDRIQV